MRGAPGASYCNVFMKKQTENIELTYIKPPFRIKGGAFVCRKARISEQVVFIKPQKEPPLRRRPIKPVKAN